MSRFVSSLIVVLFCFVVATPGSAAAGRRDAARVCWQDSPPGATCARQPGQGLQVQPATEASGELGEDSLWRLAEALAPETLVRQLQGWLVIHSQEAADE